MPAGRHTLYDVSYCERAIELGQTGASVTEIAANIGIVKQTLYDWERAHPEFLDAMARARDESQVWWEKKGRDNLATQGFQSSMWSRSMAARFPDDWRERREDTVNVKGDLGAMIAAARERTSGQ